MVTALKDQFAALGAQAGKQELSNMAGLLSALRTNPEVAQQLIQQKIDAATNSGDAQEAASFKALQETARVDPVKAFNSLTPFVAALGKEGQDMLASVYGAEKTSAEIDKAVADATIAKANATTAPENARADAQLKAANAQKAKVEADYAEKEITARLKKIAAETGASNASIAKTRAEIKNLNTTGQMLRLDWEAASQGLLMPSKKTEGGNKPAPTEDERKTAVNLAQATNAYKNLLDAMYTKEGKRTGAEKPEMLESIPLIGSAIGGVTRSTNRERFNQASASLSEALLRVATGAGITKDETEQKIKEITPLYTDDEATRNQKLASIPEYLKAIQVRAGRALPEDYKMPEAPKQQRNITVEF
jgi:hypothetical protein